MQNGTPAPCAPATIPGLSSSDGFSSQTHGYGIGAAPGCESFQSSTRPKRSARSLIALACPLGPRLLPKRRRKIGIRSSSSERTHCGGCMAVRGEVCANSVAPHRGMALAWAMTGLHGDSEVRAPWRGGDITPVIRSPDGREGRNRFKTALVPLIRRAASPSANTSLSPSNENRWQGTISPILRNPPRRRLPPWRQDVMFNLIDFRFDWT